MRTPFAERAEHNPPTRESNEPAQSGTTEGHRVHPRGRRFASRPKGRRSPFRILRFGRFGSANPASAQAKGLHPGEAIGCALRHRPGTRWQALARPPCHSVTRPRAASVRNRKEGSSLRTVRRGGVLAAAAIRQAEPLGCTGERAVAGGCGLYRHPTPGWEPRGGERPGRPGHHARSSSRRPCTVRRLAAVRSRPQSDANCVPADRRVGRPPRAPRDGTVFRAFSRTPLRLRSGESTDRSLERPETRTGMSEMAAFAPQAGRKTVRKSCAFPLPPPQSSPRPRPGRAPGPPGRRRFPQPAPRATRREESEPSVGYRFERRSAPQRTPGRPSHPRNPLDSRKSTPPRRTNGCIVTSVGLMSSSGSVDSPPGRPPRRLRTLASSLVPTEPAQLPAPRPTRVRRSERPRRSRPGRWPRATGPHPTPRNGAAAP